MEWVLPRVSYAMSGGGRNGRVGETNRAPTPEAEGVSHPRNWRGLDGRGGGRARRGGGGRAAVEAVADDFEAVGDGGRALGALQGVGADALHDEVGERLGNLGV